MANPIYKNPLDLANQIQSEEKGQPKGRDWGYDRLPKDWDDYSTDARLTFYESKFPNDDNPKFKQAILDEYKERINATKKENEERSNKWNAFKQSTQYPQGVFRKDLDDWDKLHKEYSDILGEDAAYDLLYKVFGK